MRTLSGLKIFLLLLSSTIFLNKLRADTTYIKFGSLWKYLDNGTAAPTGAGAADWRNIAFNDAAWQSNIGEFGYGDEDERTVVNYGGNAGNKYITTYFRKTISIPDLSTYSSIRLNTYIDDGAVIYVNGTEVARYNLAAGAVNSSTLASASATEDGNRITSFDISIANFVAGNNIIAVEVHQNNATSSDLSFDFELITKTGGNLFSYGSTWKYLDNGSNQGTGWTAAAFADGAWLQGPGQLGYGDGDEATVVGFGGNSSSKYITTYFRKTFSITGYAAYASFSGKVKRDDAIVVYANGAEVFRNNITNPLTYTKLATSNVEDAEFTFTIPKANLQEGSNTIAVEIHQSAANSSDVSFDMELSGVSATSEPEILRGPLLQMVSGNAITIKWKTDINSTSRLKYGTDPNNLNNTISDNSAVTDHELRITGLTADTKYYYAIGTNTAIIKGSYRNYFITAPPANTTRKIRIGVFGDAGTGNTNQKGTRDAYLQLKKGTNNSELALLLGDNAYEDGLENEHQSKFFDIYDDNVLDNHVVFPVPGNHEYANNGTLATNHSIPYYDIFTLPTAAQSGGTVSGTEHYYSFDYGNIHFIMLDSYGYDGGKLLYDSTGDQALWLKSDLAANANVRKWIVVSLHHPPYTNGTHASNSESDLTAIRQQITPILERYGVDVVLAGHSHVYERSFLVQGHTGTSTTFNNGTTAGGKLVNGSSARYNGVTNSCPYFTIDSTYKHGTVYVVAGSAGQIGGGSNSQYPVFYYRNYSGTTGGEVGVLYLEVEDNRLDAKFVGAGGTVRDQFSIMKSTNKKTTVLATRNVPVTLNASWVGSYNWYTTPTTPITVLGNNRSLEITPASVGAYTYFVNDSISPTTTCVADTFLLQVTSSLAVSVSRFTTTLKNNKVFVQWTTAQESNSDHFVVERSSNGRDYEMLMVVSAAGDATVATNYEFIDNNPLEGISYYRLVAVDKTGDSKTAGVQSISIRRANSFGLIITPNPGVNNSISTIIKSNKKQLLQVTIYNMSGAELYNRNMKANTGDNPLKVQVPAGTHILNIESTDGTRITEKVLVK